MSLDQSLLPILPEERLVLARVLGVNSAGVSTPLLKSPKPSPTGAGGYGALLGPGRQLHLFKK